MILKYTLFIVLVAYRVEVAAQQSIGNFSLYAYGTGIEPGLRLFYGDGHAYIGASPPSFVSEAVNVTFSEQGENIQFVANPESPMNWSTLPILAVDNTTGASNPVSFVNGNNTENAGSISGFGLYGGWAFHKNGAGEVEMKFIATTTNESDVYLVKWNAAASKSEDDISIALRTLAPTKITS